MPFDAASYIMGKNASGGGGSTVTVEPLSVTENGTYTAPDGEAYTPVTVAVPNTYSASDEGKVVDDGALVAQTSLTVTQNGTVDTTLNNEVVVNVPTGGGGVASNDVNFIDYDGTIVYSYSAADFANLTELPANPSHSGLTAQGWNWTLADAKTYVASYGFLDIGQMYVTDDGKTRIYVHFEEGRTSPYLGLAVNGTVDIDWGDGSTHDTLTGTSTSTVVTIQHVFQPGDYVITLTPASGTEFSFSGSTNAGSRVLNKTAGGTLNESRAYQNAIKSINVGAGVTSIGGRGFSGCFSLASISIPDSVTSIGSYAFNNCYCLASIVIPDGVISIESYTFSGCYCLASIVIPNGVRSIANNAFSSCYSLASIIIPDGVTIISSNTFSGCTALVSIVIPDGVASIGSDTFNGCNSLTSIVIPADVTSIGLRAFNTCYSLASIKFEPTTPPTVSSSNAFTSIPTDCIIYVPFASLAAYLSATNYPASATYTYLGFATYASGATLPTQDTTSAYNVTWYATKEDAKVGTNPITQGNGSEVYCTYAAV